ncbi:MAG TPA: ferritin-like domain-containing protein [Polyangiaceae bacterium]|jgi:hypothetical protein
MALENIVLSGALSETPLARRHEQTIAGKLVRLPKALPWNAFDRKKHPETALALAVDLWSGLARGEYSAVGLFAHVAAGLSFIGAPLDFVHAATQVSTDETRHAEHCLRMAALCAGEKPPVTLALSATHAALAPLVDIEELDFAMIHSVALSETLATALLTECKRRARDRLSRAVFTALLSDEVHHARLGWFYVAHRSPQWTLGERKRLADRVAQYVVHIEREFWMGRDAPREAVRSARELGTLDSKTQRAVIRDVMENEVVPALDAVGFGGSRVWAMRRRGGSTLPSRKRS